MVSILQSLKVSAVKRSLHVPPVVQRRNRLMDRIHEQIQAAQARLQGKQFTVNGTRKIKNKETGEMVEMPWERKIREGWWNAEDGKVLFELRYGSKPLDIIKGKSTIEIGDLNNLVPTLEKLKQAVQLGEFDEQMAAAAGRLTTQLAGKKAGGK